MDTGERITIAVITGTITAWLGEMWIFVIFTLVAILLDYCTGLLAGRANEGINSKKALKGLQKKLGVLSLLCLGLFLDVALNHLIADGLTVEIPFDAPIAHIVTMWIVITESISVCENLERLGIPIPGWMKKMLQKSKKDISDEGEKS